MVTASLFRSVCHGRTVGLSADISTASAALLTYSLVSFYNGCKMKLKESIKNMERNYKQPYLFTLCFAAR